MLGLTQRTGINHLTDLLRLHPQVRPPEPIWEDYVVHELHRLEDYVTSVATHWNPRWKPEGAASALREALGRGLADFLCGIGDPAWRGDLVHPCPITTGPDSRPLAPRCVTKTPSTQDLALLHRYLPRSPCLILVRDGRSVVASAARGFGTDWRKAAHLWATRGRGLRAELESGPAARRATWKVVRFEELVRRPEPILREVLAHVGLATADYPFDRVRTAPVIGSSYLQPDGVVTWKSLPRPAGFDPTTRFADWPAQHHEEFEAIAGDVLDYFGYERHRRAGHARRPRRETAARVSRASRARG